METNQTALTNLETESKETEATELLADLPVAESTETDIIGGPTSVQWPYHLFTGQVRSN